MDGSNNGGMCWDSTRQTPVETDVQSSTAFDLQTWKVDRNNDDDDDDDGLKQTDACFVIQVPDAAAVRNGKC